MMRTSTTIRLLALGTACIAASPALASNAKVQKALAQRPELSSFYQGLLNTGVLGELKPDATYTIFAPTNKAMERISQERYPCFYSQQCVGEVADILRNHIVEGPILLGSGPDVNAAYSIDHTQITFGNNSPNHENTRASNYTVNGARIVKNTALGGGQLYEINGVLASPQELAGVMQYKYVEVDGPEVVIVPMPTHAVVTTNQVFYAPDGSPDGISQTITQVPEER